MASSHLAAHSNNEAITASTKTFDEGDAGLVQNCTVTTTITLPSTVVGTPYTVRVGAEGITVTISPAAADKIMGNGYTSADNKDIVCTSGNIGDFVELVGDGANGWFVVRSKGTWTREAE